MTEREKMAAGYLYNANYDPDIVAEIEAMNDLCHELNQLRPSQRQEQQALLRRILGSMGDGCCVNPPFWVDYGKQTAVGDFFFANRNCQIQDGGGVTFGSHVFIGPNCTFTTAEHALDAAQRSAGLEVALPIHVGDSVWFGAGCTVLAGVTIGSNTVIAAGSVVTRDIPANVIAAGVPCRVLRPITDADKHRYPHAPEDAGKEGT